MSGSLGDVVARESIILAVRELLVLLLIVGFFAWVGYRVLRESRR
jgi:hypothetical protein